MPENLSVRLSVMGGAKVQEKGVQNALPVVNPIEDKEEDECISLGYRCNDFPADGICDLRNYR